MAQLIKEMCDKFPEIDHLLLAGLADWEVETANSIYKQVGEHGNFKMLKAGPDDFSLVCHAETIVINDTGLRHLAIVAGTLQSVYFLYLQMYLDTLHYLEIIRPLLPMKPGQPQLTKWLLLSMKLLVQTNNLILNISLK